MATSTETVTLSCRDGQISTGDTSWVLISSILVLAMMPALAFFEAGMLRSKNTLAILTQVLIGLSLLSVLWAVVGFSLVFGTDHGGFIGGFQHVLLIKTPYFDCLPGQTIPAACYALFQSMFAAITPLLMTGAVAERMKLQALLIFIVLWEIVVYYPVAHWVWGGGWLGAMGVLDFAGGIVIHTTAGAGSLVAAVVLGPRKHFLEYHGEFPPSNLPLAAVGAGLLWMGWFGFNGGSALAAGAVAVSAVLSTQLAASVSTVVWVLLSALHGGKPSATTVFNGALAGLAGITPASGYLSSPSTLVVGLILGIASFYGVRLIKLRLHIDDALDVSSIHGIPGAIGALAIGFASEKAVNPDGADGLFFGNPRLLAVQLLAVVVAAAWATFWTYVLLKIISRCMGNELRVSSHAEHVGLDWAEHGEVAYHNLAVLDDTTMRASIIERMDMPTSAAYRRFGDAVSTPCSMVIQNQEPLL